VIGAAASGSNVSEHLVHDGESTTDQTYPKDEGMGRQDLPKPLWPSRRRAQPHPLPRSHHVAAQDPGRKPGKNDRMDSTAHPLT